MDELAPYRGAPAPIAAATRGAVAPGGFPAAAPAGVGTPYGPDLAAVKSPADYLGALRRRAWLALIVAVPLGTLASIYALRQPKIYQAMGQIRIEAPHFDSALSALVARDMGQGDASSQASYAADRVTDLQYGRALAERVIARNQFGPEVAQMDDPAAELIVDHIAVKPVLKSNTYNVTLNGRDPALTKRLLEAVLEEMVKAAKDEQAMRVGDTVENARRALRTLIAARDDRQREMLGQMEALGTIGPGGRSILEEQYAKLGQSIEAQQARLGELQQKMMFAQYFPRDEAVSPRETAALAQRERLAEMQEDLRDRLADLRRKTRHFDSDPAARMVAGQLHKVMTKIDEIDDSFAAKTQMTADPTELIHESLQRDVETRQARQEEMLTQIQKAMPDQQKYLYLLEDHASIRKQIDDMTSKLQAFEILAKSQEANPPVKVLGMIKEPSRPMKSKTTLIVMGLVVSLGTGIGLVVLLEHLDHSAKVPEHVSHGLNLPLLGVVPRTPRTALTHRGGHLWTAGAPDSAAADAFRNIRAGLLGAADLGGPIVSLLVSSAKAGEGKSTTALNLAAACARAGERTLLLDVDLRRPTLDAAFPADAGDDDGLGLVDVLKGAVPWQATLRRTELHNLDFIPAGDPRDVPIEILGTLELRQLLTALTHHYDRVILDGPAILGMADCRVLGRMVDAAVLVVRAGAHRTVTLQRAKAVLEQSRVEIAGVIVNGLSDGAQHWSSHAYGAAAVAAYRRDRALPAAAAVPEAALADA